MRFTYEGFTQNGAMRNFLFLGIDDDREESFFSLYVDLALLIENRVPVQEAPLFCQELLSRACTGGASFLDKLHKYQIVSEDLRPMLTERAAREAKKKLQRSRATYRKPSQPSNMILNAADTHRSNAI